MVPHISLFMSFALFSLHGTSAQERCYIDFTNQFSSLLGEVNEFRVARRGSTYYSVNDNARAKCSGYIKRVWVIYKTSGTRVPYDIASMFIGVRNITTVDGEETTVQAGRSVLLNTPMGSQGSDILPVSHHLISIPSWAASRLLIERGQTVGVFINTNSDLSGVGVPWLIGDVGDSFEVPPGSNAERVASLMPGIRFYIEPYFEDQIEPDPTTSYTPSSMSSTSSFSLSSSSSSSASSSNISTSSTGSSTLSSSSSSTSSSSSASSSSSSSSTPTAPFPSSIVSTSESIERPKSNSEMSIYSTTPTSEGVPVVSRTPTSSVLPDGSNRAGTPDVSLAFIISPVVSAVFVIGVIIMIVIVVCLKKSDKIHNKSTEVYSVELAPVPAGAVGITKDETLGPNVQRMVIPFPQVPSADYEVMPSSVTNQMVLATEEFNYESPPMFTEDQKSNYYSTVSYNDCSANEDQDNQDYDEPAEQIVFRTDSDYEDIWSDSEDVGCPFPSEMYESAGNVLGPRTLPRNMGVEDEVYDDILGPYSVPPSTELEIYDELKQRNCTTVQRETVKTLSLLGSGQFATVYKGLWDSMETITEVAVKTLSISASVNERIKFLQEAHVMSQFNHPNIVKLLGVVPAGKPKMIVIELMPYGDLRKYLSSLVPPKGKSLSRKVPTLLLRFARDVASGMKYLSLKGYVHRDLAARNVLLSSDHICKIGDFGLTRDITDGEIYQSRGGLIPLRWTAPEAITTGIYSPSTDVWSYGVLLYEIWSLGKRPFEEMENNQIIALLRSGGRLAPPPGCPKPMYTIMIDCWHPEPCERPDFLQIDCFLKKRNEELLWLLPKDADYIDTQALVLGSELKSGENLYPTLQHSYCA